MTNDLPPLTQPITDAAPGHRRSPEPFFEQRGPVGVLLLHGYSGAPSELRAMGVALAEAGYTVHGPLLAGHGSTPDKLYGVRWEDWAASASEGLALLRAHCRTVVVAGLSMGGLLALHLAAHEHPAGVIAMAPALKLFGQAQLRWTGLLQYPMPWFRPFARANFANPAVRRAVHERVPGADLDDPAVVAEIRAQARIPVGSLYELVRLQRHVARELPRITAPALLMQGRHDRTVVPSSVETVAASIGSADKRVAWFERSGHILPMEAEREQVWATATAWLHEHTAGEQPPLM